MTTAEETAVRAARRAVSRERQARALDLLGLGPVTLTPNGRGRMIGRGVNGRFVLVSTLHALERQRRVERRKGGAFVLAGSEDHRHG